MVARKKGAGLVLAFKAQFLVEAHEWTARIGVRSGRAGVGDRPPRVKNF